MSKPANVQEAKVQEGLARLLFDHAGTALGTNVLNGLLWGFAVWGWLNPSDILIWFAGLAGITLYRYAVLQQYRKHQPSGQQLELLVTLYTIGALLAGVAWAAAGIMLINTHNLALQALAGFLMAGMAAGAVAINAANLMTYFAFSLPMLVPLTPLLVLEGGRIQLVMGVMSAVFILVMNRAVRQTHETMRRSLALGSEKASLVQDLGNELDERKKVEEALFMEKELAQVTLRSLGDAVVTTDLEGRVLSLNLAGESLTGWTETEAKGRLFGEVFRLASVHSDTSLAEDPVAICIRQGKPYSHGTHLQLMDRSGMISYSVELTSSPIRDRAGRAIGAVAVCHDVSALSYAASHDVLTGLINRREFLVRLEHAVSNAHTDQAEHALCYIDLDQFKVVNDTCGHSAGDELLRELTSLLHEHVREGDTLARLGGDEFGLLLPYCPLQKATQIAEAMRKLVKDFRFNWGGRVFEIGASIGVVQINKSSTDVAELLRAADSACYVAKAQGRNRVHLYQSDDRAVTEHQENIAWVTRIRQGLEHDHFTLFLQTIQPLGNTKAGEHFEVLVRLRDGNGKLIQPATFLPAAERYDLMPMLDRWVIHNAMKRLAPMLQQDPTRLCAINLSGQSLGDEKMVSFILEEIAHRNIPPSTLCFEITETSAISHLGKARQLAQRLKAAGCYLALDDFGSGLSSFSYLKELPVDFLKIDGAFVKNIEHNPTDRAIVSSIVHVACTMGKRTIAEYVEGDAALHWISKLGVDYAQGYFIGEPRPLENFADEFSASLPENAEMEDSPLSSARAMHVA
jgi:diguanylate cyclase (GGDEF)-like protein/PAS domain S-box-containing protein